MNVAPVARGTLVARPAYAVRYGEVLRVVELELGRFGGGDVVVGGGKTFNVLGEKKK